MPWSNASMREHSIAISGRRHTLVIAVSVGLLALFAVLWASPVAAQSEDTVTISDRLAPAQLEIETGAMVTWRNADGERHRMRSEDGPERFDSGNLEPGESYSHTFTIEGSYPYYDHRDRDDSAYFGMIVVGGTSTPIGGPLPDTGAVSIIDKSFQPPSLTIATGGTINWSNDDGEAHTVTSTDQAFDSGILSAGAGFEQTFTESGSFPYFCLIHPEMRGTITVSDPVPVPASDVPIVEAPASEAPVAEEPDVLAASPDVVSASPDVASTISVVDRSFQPSAVEVVAGDTVSWSNDDSEGHTVTAVDGSFNSGVLTVGDEFYASFGTAGTFDYFCAIHPEMTGAVTVTEPST